jgi:hypothetical protein
MRPNQYYESGKEEAILWPDREPIRLIRLSLNGSCYHSIENKCGGENAHIHVQLQHGNPVAVYRGRAYSPCWKCLGAVKIRRHWD